MAGKKPRFIQLLGALAFAGMAVPPGTIVAHAAKHHVTLLSVTGMYRLCSRDRSPFGVSHGTVAVTGYYRILPFPGPGELGTLFDHKIAPDAAYQITSTPIRGTTSQQMAVKIAGGGLVIMGPRTVVPHSRPGIPDARWVVIRGTLFCHHLQQVSPFFLNAAEKPYMYVKSWRHVQKPRAGVIPRDDCNVAPRSTAPWYGVPKDPEVCSARPRVRGRRSRARSLIRPAEVEAALALSEEFDREREQIERQWQLRVQGRRAQRPHPRVRVAAAVPVRVATPITVATTRAPTGMVAPTGRYTITSSSSTTTVLFTTMVRRVLQPAP